MLAILSKEWECEFEGADDLRTHPIVRPVPFNTRDALYGAKTEAMRLHYKIKEGVESVQYWDESTGTSANISRSHRSYDHSGRASIRRHRSLSKDGRANEMQDRNAQTTTTPSYHTDTM